MKRTRTAIAALVACAVALFAAPAANAAEQWEALGGAIGAAEPNPDESGFDLKRVGGAPMLAYAHRNGTNHEIRVVRWDGSAWQSVGTRVNADPSHEATHPSLAAGPGGVPWVSWVERDDDNIRQIRVARYSASKNRFVEPVGGDWPVQPRPPKHYHDPELFYGFRTDLAFLGSRPHVLIVTETPSEFVIGIRRLSADRRSWQRVTAPSRYINSDFDGTVIGDVLHTVAHSRIGGTDFVDRLGPNGWEQVGGAIAEADPSDPYDTPIAGLAAGSDGVPHAAWNVCCEENARGMVARLVDGHWRNVGGDVAPRVGDIRSIGGRIWVAASNGGLRVARLNEDESAWILSPPLQSGLSSVLAGVDGVPHIAYLDSDGRVRVARLTGVPPIGPDDNDGTASPCTHADTEVTKSFLAPPLPAEWPPRGSTDDPDASCQTVDSSPPPGGGEPGPNPPPGPCGFRVLGTPKADRLTGDGLRNEIAGRSGNDTILGLGGDDCLFGNAGDDVLKGGPGADRLSGDSGHDRLVGGDGNDSVKAGSGNDVVDARGKGFDKIDCGPGRDKALVGDLDRVRNCERVVNAD